jgi:hypothetical protein
LTVPPPEPVAPPVTVSHVSLLVAVQEQPVGDATVKDPVPPVALMLRLGGVNVNVQGTPA